MNLQVCFFDLGETLVTGVRQWLPGAKSLLASLKSKGLRLGIVSNTANLTPRQAILDILPIDFGITIFEPSLVLFSSEVGIEKPKMAMFQKAVAAVAALQAAPAIQASQCLYVSENIVETLMAQYVGMRSIRVQTAPHSDFANLASKLAEFALLT